MIPLVLYDFRGRDDPWHAEYIDLDNLRVWVRDMARLGIQVSEEPLKDWERLRDRAGEPNLAQLMRTIAQVTPGLASWFLAIPDASGEGGPM